MTDRRTVSERLTKAGLERCVRHLEAARDHRSRMATHTRDPDVRRRLLGECSAFTLAVDHIRAEWGLK